MQRRLRRLRLKLLQIRFNPLRLATVDRQPAAALSGALMRGCSLSMRALLCALGALITMASPEAHATQGNGDIAEFIVNFVRYTAWPADPSRKAVTICYAHGGALAPAAIMLEQPTTVKGLTLAWRQVSLPAQTAGCDALWLNADVRPAPREWLVATSEKPVLTISNYADFTADGGIVGAYRAGSDWRFEVNLEALHRARINIAAAALRLSQKPKSTSTGEPR